MSYLDRKRLRERDKRRRGPGERAIVIEIDWVERVNETERFHREACLTNPTQTIMDTSIQLKRSYGSINEDLQLASWLKSYPKLADVKRMQDAMAWVKDKKKEIKGRK